MKLNILIVGQGNQQTYETSDLYGTLQQHQKDPSRDHRLIEVYLPQALTSLSRTCAAALHRTNRPRTANSNSGSHSDT